MNRRAKVFLIIGAVSILVTLLVALINITVWDGVALPAVLFLLLAELVLFGGFALIERLAEKTAQVFFRAGCGVTLVFYFVLSCTSSLVFLFWFAQALAPFYTIQLILAALAAILCIVFFSTGKSIGEKAGNS